MKKISRREFFKSLGGLTAVSGERKQNTHESGTDTDWEKPHFFKGKEVTTVCTGCDRGCGIIMTVRDGKVTRFEGDPDHPANEGFLCEDAETLFALYTSNELHNGEWMPELLHRPAGTDAWEISDWSRTLRSIARRIKETRDASISNELRQAQGIGCILNHALLNNEETYLLYKLFKALGVAADQTGSERSGALSFILQESIVKGLFVWGGGFLPDEPAGKVLRFIGNLDWLVYVNWFKSEEEFLKEREKIAKACPRSEVFILPAAAPWEKTGSLVSAGRWVQWCTKAMEPRGQARIPLWILDRIYKELCEQYRGDGLYPEPILNLKWDYAGDTLPDVKMVAAEINGDSSNDNHFFGGLTVPSFVGYWAEKEVPSMRRGFGGEWGFKLLR